MNDPIPVESLSDAQLLREIALNMRYLREQLRIIEPLLAVLQGGNGAAPDYLTVSGLRKAFRRSPGPGR